MTELRLEESLVAAPAVDEHQWPIARICIKHNLWKPAQPIKTPTGSHVRFPYGQGTFASGTRLN